MKRAFAILLAVMLAVPAVSAQNERRSVRKGNHDFRKDKYQEAEIDYKKALVADSLSNAAAYNLGNTYYRMEDFANAAKNYEAVADSLAKDPENGAALYHNLGNALLKQQNYQGAIEAYKNALRRNPSDMDTKTNLSYAKKMLENQQNQDQQNKDQQNRDQQNQQDQNNKDQDRNQNDRNQDQNQNKDQNKDRQNQDQNRNQQDQEQDKQNQDNRQQEQQSGMNQKDAQQILQAIQSKEDDTQEKVKKEKALMMQSKQKDKNW